MSHTVISQTPATTPTSTTESASASTAASVPASASAQVSALSLKSLDVEFSTRQGVVNAVQDLTLDVARGQTLAVVGESGSGKSVSAYAVLQLLEANGSVTGGSITFDGIDLLALNSKELKDVRGREIAMIFQNPRAALNPVRKVGQQIEDVLICHHRVARRGAKAAAVKLLEQVEIRDAANRYHAYPFELSGGMCQRIGIALALACEPRLLIADEPTTGLDITTQNSVMELMMSLVRQKNMSAILITHDLGLAAAYCDQVVVMRDGRLVESGGPGALFQNPREAYTQKLIDATPHRDKSVRQLLPVAEQRSVITRPPPGDVVLSVSDLSCEFQTPTGPVHAVKHLSFDLRKGECLGLVGESGSGKSTTAAMVAKLLDPTSGSITLTAANGEPGGIDLAAIPSSRFIRHPQRASIQMVFQDAGDSIDPRHSARQAIEQPLRGLTRLGRRQRRLRVDELAEQVGLPQHLLSRFSHQLSGGQRARVNIARAIAVAPEVLILDEPTAALDVSIQAIVLNLLADLQAQLGLAYLFISHDLYVIRLLCDRVMVMRNGTVVESESTARLMNSPQHDYTRELLSAMPEMPVPDKG